MTLSNGERAEIAERIKSLVLPKLDGVRPDGDGWKARCPVHDDDKPSLGIKVGDTQPLLRCRAGCHEDAVLGKLGITWGDLKPRRARPPSGRSDAVATYTYRDASGQVVFVKERKPNKKFSIKRPDGRGGWVFQGVFAGKEAAPKVLYRLPELIAAVKDGRTVFVVEGEKDCDNLAARGYVATCNYDGAALDGQNQKWRPELEYAQHFEGADVVVIADRDNPGYAHARAIVHDLRMVAKSIRVVEAAMDKTGADVTDHLNAGLTMDQLRPVDLGEDVERYTAPHLRALPQYPVDALVGPLAEMVKATRSMGLPAAFTAGAGLAALATAAGMADLQVYDSWIVRPALWVPLIGPAGAAKTPSINTARRRIRERDVETYHVFKALLDNWKARPKKDRGERPDDDRRLIDDATLEMVARRLSHGDGVLGVDSDELTNWLSGMGRYRNSGDGGDRARWLSMWSCSPWSYERVSDDLHILVPRPVVTVCGGIQPHLLSLLGPEGDGMRPRWLPHMSLDTNLKPKPGKIPDSWDQILDELYDARHPRTWTLDGQALARWQAAQRRWKESSRGVESPSTSAALVKADEQAARIALVLAESIHPGQGGPIPDEAMSAAVAIVDYCMDVWRAMPEHRTLALSRRDESLDSAVDELAAWLEQRGGRMPKNKIQSARPAGIRTAAALNEVLARYEEVYPGSFRTERTGSRGPASVVVYAPRRGDSALPDSHPSTYGETPDVRSFRVDKDSESRRDSAGHRADQLQDKTTDTVSSFGVSSNSSGVSDTTSSGPPLTLINDDDQIGEWSA